MKQLTQEEMRDKPVGTLFMKRENGTAGRYVFTEQEAEDHWTREECCRILEALRPDLRLDPGDGAIEVQPVEEGQDQEEPNEDGM